MDQKEKMKRKSDIEKFYDRLSKDVSLNIATIEREALHEGIDVEFRNGHGFVSMTGAHKKGVNTSWKSNQTLTRLEVDAKNLDIAEVEVFSIFQIPSGSPGDGNSLMFALKDENNFIFKRGEKVRNRVKKIIKKFLKDIYFKKIGRQEFSTIVVPSGKAVNSRFARLVKEMADQERKGMTQLYDDVLMKVPVDLIRNLVLYDAGSMYNQWLYDLPDDRIEQLSAQFEHDLDLMDEKRNGYFTYHIVLNRDMRNMISSSLSACNNETYSGAFSPINDKHVFLVDDLMSRGSTLKDATRNLCSCYHPASVTALALLSQKY